MLTRGCKNGKQGKEKACLKRRKCPKIYAVWAERGGIHLVAIEK
jgi:hypothetical protein